MRRCLRDRSLLLVYYGEGRIAHMAHIETCSTCAARYRQLVQDLELIGHALERLPSPLSARRPRKVSWQRQITLAATLAAGVAMVVGVGIWQWQDTHVQVQRRGATDNMDTLRFLADVSSILSTTSDGELSVLPPASDQDEIAPREPEGSPGEVEGTWMRDGTLDTDT